MSIFSKTIGATIAASALFASSSAWADVKLKCEETSAGGVYLFSSGHYRVGQGRLYELDGGSKNLNFCDSGLSNSCRLDNKTFLYTIDQPATSGLPAQNLTLSINLETGVVTYIEGGKRIDYAICRRV